MRPRCSGNPQGATGLHSRACLAHRWYLAFIFHTFSMPEAIDCKSGHASCSGGALGRRERSSCTVFGCLPSGGSGGRVFSNGNTSSAVFIEITSFEESNGLLDLCQPRSRPESRACYHPVSPIFPTRHGPSRVIVFRAASVKPVGRFFALLPLRVFFLVNRSDATGFTAAPDLADVCCRGFVANEHDGPAVPGCRRPCFGGHDAPTNPYCVRWCRWLRKQQW